MKNMIKTILFVTVLLLMVPVFLSSDNGENIKTDKKIEFEISFGSSFANSV